MRKTTMRYKCTICCILGFRHELWKSGVNLIKIPWIPKFYQHKQQRKWNFWLKISMACHIFQSLFLAPNSKKVADPCAKVLCHDWLISNNMPQTICSCVKTARELLKCMKKNSLLIMTCVYDGGLLTLFYHFMKIFCFICESCWFTFWLCIF